MTVHKATKNEIGTYGQTVGRIKTKCGDSAYNFYFDAEKNWLRVDCSKCRAFCKDKDVIDYWEANTRV